jgi:hypothetical protein
MTTAWLSTIQASHTGYKPLKNIVRHARMSEGGRPGTHPKQSPSNAGHLLAFAGRTGDAPRPSLARPLEEEL